MIECIRLFSKRLKRYQALVKAHPTKKENDIYIYNGISYKISEKEANNYYFLRFIVPIITIFLAFLLKLYTTTFITFSLSLINFLALFYFGLYTLEHNAIKMNKENI